MSKPRIYHNPRCSKSRGCLQILEERGLAVEQVRYLEERPDRGELEWLWQRLGRDMLRQGEALYRDLDLAQASVERILDALVQHPILIERPIVILGDRAVVARPPEKVRELLMERQ
ncbi:MAG: arsenate reductase (glutaredoxin) [Candidatus Eremiobacteraeota bacterium]|nr:arsenate reductase (glutaredoxin) [Candidatus Eremiobacteraeota bacterium]MCW5866050.1 arsenate reductase (glutaredoxin) [Candidatus Eremiobacteraeota bacterium]